MRCRRIAALFIFTVASTVISVLPVGAQHAADPAGAEATAARLIAAYPTFIERRDGNALVWRDGKRMAIDDGRGPKTPAARIDAPDLKDMLAVPYPFGAAPPPDHDVDPGRSRNTAFFAAMYGDCRRNEVKANLVPVVWLPKKWGKKLEVTRINGVADRLAAVSDELDALPARFDTYLFPPAGTYNCRAIAGTERQSAHGFGIAIDIAIKQTDYWRWTKPTADGALSVSQSNSG